MKLSVLAVDKLRKKPCRALCTDYAKRLERHSKLKIVELSPSNKRTREERCADESARLLAAAPRNALIIALDERGVECTSAELAAMMQEDMLRGRSHWVLAVGGAGGHHESLRARADRTLSLSRLTLPHELARVVLLEQLYRALSIIHNEPYHRED